MSTATEERGVYAMAEAGARLWEGYERGFLTEAPPVDYEKCEVVVEEGEAKGIYPTEEEVKLAVQLIAMYRGEGPE